MNWNYKFFCMIHSECALFDIENYSRFVDVLQGNSWKFMTNFVCVLFGKQALYVLYKTR